MDNTPDKNIYFHFSMSVFRDATYLKLIDFINY